MSSVCKGRGWNNATSEKMWGYFAISLQHFGAEGRCQQDESVLQQPRHGMSTFPGEAGDRAEAARGRGQRQEGTVPAGLAHGPTSDMGRADSFMDFIPLPESTLATSFA